MSNRAEMMLQEFRVNAVQSSYRVNEQEMYARLAHEIKFLLLSERQEPLTYEIYATWFQHLKDKVFPAWLKKWFPVKKVTKEITFSTVYPKIKTKIPPDIMGDRIIIMLNSKPRFVFDPALEDKNPTAWQEEVYKKSLSAWNTDYDTCPFCKRKVYGRD